MITITIIESDSNYSVSVSEDGSPITVTVEETASPIVVTLSEQNNGEGGTSDHGELDGLSGDDHPQYHNDARGDVRYYTKSQINTSLSGKEDSGTAAAAVAAHEIASDPHPQYLTPAEGNAAYDPAGSALTVQTNLTSHTGNTSNPHSVTKSQVGLANVDNTSDANKPVSTAQAAADAVIQSDLDTHKANTSNPHSVTKTQVGLGNVDNTSDANKPVSTATQTALDLKEPIRSSVTSAQMFALTPASGTKVWCTTFNTEFIYLSDRWMPSGRIDPKFGFLIEDEFLNSSTAFSLGWAVGATVAVVPSVSTGAAVIRQNAASARGSLSLAASSVVLGSSIIYMEWDVKIPTLATVAEDYATTIGLNDAAAYVAGSLGTDLVTFTYNRSVNGDFWILNTSSNGTPTSVNTSTAIAADTYYRLGILITNATRVDYFVNGTNVGNITTNIPSGTSRATGYQIRLDKSAGSSNSDIQVDYFLSYQLLNSARVS